MRIVLISPTAENEYHVSDVWSKISKDLLFAPYGLQLLASLTSEKHEVKIIDENIGQKIDFDENVDLVGITVMTPQAPRAYSIAKKFKEKGIKVVMGGYHVSLLPEEAGQYCDSLAVGEADYTWQQIVEDAENGTLKKIYKSDKLIDLSEVNWPKRSLSPRKKYRAQNLIQTTRGCPFKCNFCSVVNFFGNSYRIRPVDDIVAEIKSIKDRGELTANIVYFIDDNIVGNPKYAKELFKALIPLKIKWVSQCSITIANDDELLMLAKKSGCLALLIGFESVSDISLKAANKTIGGLDKYRKAIKKMHNHKILIFGLFMFGFDTDEKSIFDDTVKFIEDNCIEFATFSVLTPLPGTEIFEEYEKQGRLLHKNWSFYDVAHTVFKPKLMSPQELQEGFYNASQKLYTFRSIFKRVFGARTRLLFPLLINFGIKKMYKHLPKDVFYGKKSKSESDVASKA